MRITLLLVGTLMVFVVVLVWPPAVVHISREAYEGTFFQDSTVTVTISYVRAGILALAIVTFIAGVVSAIVSAVRHRTN